MPDSLLSVVTPASAPNSRLCTLAAVKTELGLSGSSLDTELDGYRDQASRDIATWCGRVFAEEVLRQTYRLTRWMNGPLLLARRPVTAIATVTEDGSALSSTDYEWDGERGMLWRLSSDVRSPWSAAKIVVDFTAGWRVPDLASPTLPADVQRAAVLQVAAIYQGKGRDRAIRSESVDGVSATSFLDPRAGQEQLPPEVAARLESYRNIPL